MSDGASQVLASIPKLVQNRDAAALVGLRDHDDKEIRKAVRKALHTLKSRGIEIPDASPKVWSSAGTLDALRGDLTPVAVVERDAKASVLSFALSEPRRDDGAVLFSGAITDDDQVVGFNGYAQTDGQRARSVREWFTKLGDRRVNIEWLKARVLWAREQSMAAGHGVPRALNEALALLGTAPKERPTTFLRESDFGDAAGFMRDALEEILQGLDVPQWPAVLDLEGMLEKAAQIHGDKPQPTEESERLALLQQSVDGDARVREGLANRVANILDDVAIAEWTKGELGLARCAFEMAVELRRNAEPEKLVWVPRFLGYQVASLLRAVGGPDAVRKAMQEQQARLQHEHVHDENCNHDHEHEHVHDENCNH